MTYQPVSVTVTACDRLDLLERTLRSFLKYNTYPIEKFVVRDDSGLLNVWKDTNNLLDSLEIDFVFLDPGQVGQARSIDLLMERVKTPHVFHLEDDWEFDRPEFIEDCFKVMGEDISQVRVRHRNDGSAAQTIRFNKIADECTNHLFSFNPHLRLAGAAKFEGSNETLLGDFVKSSGLKTLWLKNGACRHIGGEKTTNRAGTPYATGVKKA